MMLRQLALAALAFSVTAAPALAGERHPDRHPAQGYGSYGQGPVYYPPMVGAPWPTTVMVQPVDGQQGYAPQGYPQAYPQQDPRWEEMNERCRKVYGEKGVGGTLLGGVVGGVVGNRVAGKGDRVLGTVAGAAVGAIAGNMIDKGEDKGLRRECDDYFASAQQGGYGQPGYGYPGYGPGGYAPYGYVMVPVMIPSQKPCVETTVVTEKWVDEPVRRRVAPAPRRAPAVKEKRVKEKRVYTG